MPKFFATQTLSRTDNNRHNNSVINTVSKEKGLEREEDCFFLMKWLSGRNGRHRLLDSWLPAREHLRGGQFRGSRWRSPLSCRALDQGVEHQGEVHESLPSRVPSQRGKVQHIYIKPIFVHKDIQQDFQYSPLPPFRFLGMMKGKPVTEPDTIISKATIAGIWHQSPKCFTHQSNVAYPWMMASDTDPPNWTYLVT